MFCPNCGKETETGAKFCQHCGTSLTSSTIPAPPPSHAPDHEPSPEREGQPKCHCPKCGSTNIQTIVLTDTQTTGKNYSAGQGCCGWILLGPLGLLCGACGQGKKTTTTNTTMMVCNACGNQFQPRKVYEGTQKVNEEDRKVYEEKYATAVRQRESLKIFVPIMSAILIAFMIWFCVILSQENVSADYVYMPLLIIPVGESILVAIYAISADKCKAAQAELEAFDHAQAKYANRE